MHLNTRRVMDCSLLARNMQQWMENVGAWSDLRPLSVDDAN